MPTLGGVLIRFGSDVSGFQSGIQQVAAGLSGLGSTLGPIMGALPNIAAAGTSAFGALVGGMGGVIGMTGSVVDGILGLGVTLDGITRSIILDVTAWGDLANTLFSINSGVQVTMAGLTALSGSATAASADFQMIYNFAQTTPFSYAVWDGIAQRLLSLQVPASQLTTYMQAIGNATIALGGGTSTLTSIASILGVIQQEGFATTQNFRQLQAIGIPAFEYLAKALGTTALGAQTLVQEGLIRSDIAIRAVLDGIQGQFGTAMGNLAGSWVDMTNQLSNAWAMVWMAFITPTFATASVQFQNLINIMTSPAVMQFANSLGVAVGGAMANVFGWLDNLISNFSTWTAQLNNTNTALGQLWTIAKAIYSVIYSLATGAFYILSQVLPVIAYNIGPIISAFDQLGLRIIELITGPINHFNMAAGEQSGLFNLTYFITSNIVPAFHALSIAMNWVIIAIESLYAWFVQVFWPGVAPIIPGFVNLGEALVFVAGQLLGVNGAVRDSPMLNFALAVGNVVIAVINLAGALANLLAPTLRNLAPVLVQILNLMTAILDVVASVIMGVASVINVAGGGRPLTWQPATTVPSFATGIQNFTGGWAMVGERGPELVNLPGGSNIYPSMYNTGGGGGGFTIINLIVDGQQMARALGGGVINEVRLQTGIQV